MSQKISEIVNKDRKYIPKEQIESIFVSERCDCHVSSALSIVNGEMRNASTWYKEIKIKYYFDDDVFEVGGYILGIEETEKHVFVNTQYEIFVLDKDWKQND